MNGAPDTAREACRELGVTFAALLDQGRFPEVAALFAEDGVLRRADGSSFTGRREILKAQSARPASIRTVHHVSQTFVTQEAAERATGVSTFVAVTVDAEGVCANGWVIGVFDDIYRRVGDAWLIAERRIRVVHRR